MKKELNEHKKGKRWFERIRWTDWALINENDKIIGDKPDGYPGWIECPNCGNPMPYNKQDDFFECRFCNLKEFARDILDDACNIITRDCCKGCSGPYPDCLSTCKVIEN